ncbi:MAG: DUF3343 domain-containing protein [Clostridia bacterium]|nr:DUF3343 domain-containing protein [Clostridia bacterium]MBQ4323311.1 DUF3343 domain-containing protein [Clostridia bacterium]
MKSKCIAVRSVTYAQKAKSVLSQNGLSCSIIRRPQGTLTGCGWCIALHSDQVKKATELLRNNGVKLSGEIYDLP